MQKTEALSAKYRLPVLSNVKVIIMQNSSSDSTVITIDCGYYRILAQIADLQMPREPYQKF